MESDLVGMFDAEPLHLGRTGVPQRLGPAREIAERGFVRSRLARSAVNVAKSDQRVAPATLKAKPSQTSRRATTLVARAEGAMQRAQHGFTQRLKLRVVQHRRCAKRSEGGAEFAGSARSARASRGLGQFGNRIHLEVERALEDPAHRAVGTDP